MTGLGEVAFDHFLKIIYETLGEGFIPVWFWEHGKVDVNVAVVEVICFVAPPLARA